MEARRNVPDRLTCEYHGESRAGQVCGECGTPLCEDCSTDVTDVTLDDYRRTGLRTILFGVLLAVVAPLALDAVPRVYWISLTNAVGEPLYVRGGLQPALIVVGVALLATVRFRRTGDGFVLANFELLGRRSNTRTVCEDCHETKRQQRLLAGALGLLALALIGYGLYLSFTQLFFQHLRIAGVGAAVGLLRYDIVTMFFDLSA